MHKILTIAAAASAGAITVGAALLLIPAEEPPLPLVEGAVDIGGADLGGAFELTAHTGERLTDTALIDGPTLIYFGYTYCPDVCPIDTQLMVEAVDILAERGIEATPVFITVDPARDDVDSLSYFANAMHDDMIALTGSDADIAAAAKAYKVYYQRVDNGGAAGYLMNHTAFTYFMMPDGIAGLFRHATTPENMATQVERVLKRDGLS
ncbi:MAG: SCO family protein [Pseudomonadota bacterium]